MNFITTNHMGGLGNVMFKLAAAISLAIDNGVDYIFSNEFIRPVDPDYNSYKSNILRSIPFIEKLPQNYHTFNERQFSYQTINYVKGSNLLLSGYFQSEKYFINNKNFIIDLFKPTEEIKNKIIEVLPNINNYASIHVRRGDYLIYPNHHPQQSDEYFKKSTELIGRDKTFLIFSDDIDGIKNSFDYLPNKIFFNSGTDWLDMYAMSLCNDNIICNSTFSWWGAYLNTNKNKKVITTKNWFGSANAHLNTSTLFPEEWVIL
jgi:hypothetical protein